MAIKRNTRSPYGPGKCKMRIDLLHFIYVWMIQPIHEADGGGLVRVSFREFYMNFPHSAFIGGYTIRTRKGTKKLVSTIPGTTRHSLVNWYRFHYISLSMGRSNGAEWWRILNNILSLGPLNLTKNSPTRSSHIFTSWSAIILFVGSGKTTQSEPKHFPNSQ